MEEHLWNNYEKSWKSWIKFQLSVVWRLLASSSAIYNRTKILNQLFCPLRLCGWKLGELVWLGCHPQWSRGRSLLPTKNFLQQNALARWTSCSYRSFGMVITPFASFRRTWRNPKEAFKLPALPTTTGSFSTKGSMLNVWSAGELDTRRIFFFRNDRRMDHQMARRSWFDVLVHAVNSSGNDMLSTSSKTCSLSLRMVGTTWYAWGEPPITSGVM